MDCACGWHDVALVCEPPLIYWQYYTAYMQNNSRILICHSLTHLQRHAAHLRLMHARFATLLYLKSIRACQSSPSMQSSPTPIRSQITPRTQHRRFVSYDVATFGGFIHIKFCFYYYYFVHITIDAFSRYSTDLPGRRRTATGSSPIKW